MQAITERSETEIRCEGIEAKLSIELEAAKETIRRLELDRDEEETMAKVCGDQRADQSEQQSEKSEQNQQHR